jgi:hypothetical protein
MGCKKNMPLRRQPQNRSGNKKQTLCSGNKTAAAAAS